MPNVAGGHSAADEEHKLKPDSVSAHLRSIPLASDGPLPCVRRIDHVTVFPRTLRRIQRVVGAPQKLVGCQPKADLSDACVSAYIKSFGRSAFRRDLSDVEVQQWLGVAKNGAMLTSSAGS